MKGLIWGNSLQEASQELDIIRQQYQQAQIAISIERKSKFSHSIIFKNGDIWEAVSCKDSARGRSCNISYIQKGIPIEKINTIIKPCTKSIPYRAFNFFG